jgi:hypothetical protein
MTRVVAARDARPLPLPILLRVLASSSTSSTSLMFIFKQVIFALFARCGSDPFKGGKDRRMNIRSDFEGSDAGQRVSSGKGGMSVSREYWERNLVFFNGIADVIDWGSEQRFEKMRPGEEAELVESSAGGIGLVGCMMGSTPEHRWSTSTEESRSVTASLGRCSV